MRTALLSLLLAIAALAAQAIDVTGQWLATGVPYAPWTIHLKQDGTKLTGTMQQNGGLPGPVNIYEGTIEGSTLSFKADSPDGARAITFTGKIDGDQITLNRSTRIITNLSQGGAGLFGTNAAPQFTIQRGPAPATAPTDRTPAIRFSYKGVEIDFSSIQSVPDRDTVLDDLRHQIDIVDEAITDQTRKAFLKSVALIMVAPGVPGSDRYASRTKSIQLHAHSYPPGKPILLHEFMHAYHDLKLPNGFANADVRNLYQQAKTGGQFPANSYMLTNPGEYFAMMASVYLYGSADRDPFTRQAIKEKQPDCYQWLVKEFGPR